MPGDSPTLTTLPRHELRRSDGRRLLVYGELHGSLPAEEVGPRTETAAIHKRFDVFRDEWVAISPARNARPLDRESDEAEPADCPFCPGGIEVPFAYDAAVFDNRFPPFRPDAPPPPELTARRALPGDGPRSCSTPGATTPASASCRPLSSVACWPCGPTARGSYGADPAHRYVGGFENRGSRAGATVAHPHGQIYSVDHVPPIVVAKAAAHRRRAEGGCLSCAAVGVAERSTRAIGVNASFVVAVPFAPPLTVRDRGAGPQARCPQAHRPRAC
jgi:UDPglucose--hexose-1-phosphate uridylyltransferase